MKKLAFLAVLFASTAAFGQDAPKPPMSPPPAPKAQPVPPPPPAGEPTKVTPLPVPPHWTLELDQADLQTLNACIGELPYKQAAPFVAKMNQVLKPAGK